MRREQRYPCAIHTNQRARYLVTVRDLIERHERTNAYCQECWRMVTHDACHDCLLRFVHAGYEGKR